MPQSRDAGSVVVPITASWKGKVTALIATIESVGGYYFDPSLATIAMFVIVMAVLLVRPTGLMGHAT